MADFHNWTGDEKIAEQVPQLLNNDNTATLERLDTKFNNSLKITGASDLNSFKDEGLYYCSSNSQAETVLNCPTNYAFGLMVWGKEDIFYQEVREFNRGSNQNYNNCWRRSYYSEGGQGVWSNWQQTAYTATTLAGYGITDGMSKDVQNSVSTANVISRDVNTSCLRLDGGDSIESGAYLQLCGNAYSKGAGQFRLLAADSEHSAYLLGSPSGLLKWKDKNIVRSINNITADDNGNVNITVGGGGGGGGGVSTSESNTWTAQQNFRDLMLNREKYTTYVVNGTSDTPVTSTMVYAVTGAFTLNLATLAGALSASQSSVFTAYFAANADYSLTISNAGKLKYTGSAADVAITTSGLLLNIWMSKDGDGTLTSIVQATKLSWGA